MSLQWTDKSPTEPGFYWIRWDKNNERVSIVCVSKDTTNKLTIDWMGKEDPYALDPTSVFAHIWKRIEWAGPIEKPE